MAHIEQDGTVIIIAEMSDGRTLEISASPDDECFGENLTPILLSVYDDGVAELSVDGTVDIASSIFRISQSDDVSIAQTSFGMDVSIDSKKVASFAEAELADFTATIRESA